jgi:hypothetical protein
MFLLQMLLPSLVQSNLVRRYTLLALLASSFLHLIGRTTTLSSPLSLLLCLCRVRVLKSRMLSIEQGLQRVQKGEVAAPGSDSMTQQEQQQQEQLLDLLRQQGGISGQHPARMLDDKYLCRMKLHGLKVCVDTQGSDALLWCR